MVSVALSVVSFTVSTAMNKKQQRELARRISAIISDLGDDALRQARKEADNAAQSDKPRPILLDCIGSCRRAADHYKRAADNARKDREKLIFLERRCTAYSISLSTWGQLEGEERNTLREADDFVDAVNWYLGHGQFAIKNKLKGPKAALSRAARDFGRMSAMSDGFNRPYIEEAETGDRREAEKTLAKLRESRRQALRILKDLGLRTNAMLDVPDSVDKVLKQ